MSTQNKLIALAVGALVILIFLTLLLQSFFRKKEEALKKIPLPTGSYEPVGTDSRRSPTLRPEEEEKLEEQAKALKYFSPQQEEIINKFKEKLPYTSDDFDMGYSDYLGKFYMRKKTPQANEKIDQFLKDNGLFEISQEFEDLFVTTDKPVDQAINQDEEKIFEQKEEEREKIEQQYQQEQKEKESKPDKEVERITNIFDALFSFDIGEISEGTPPGGTIDNIPSADLSSLESIFNEAGLKAKTPPSILHAVMSIECGFIFDLTGPKIAEYSQAGKGIPPSHPCFRNGIGASGPMQFLPTTWTGYANAVNTIGGYTRKPYIENILDSVYAAAKKLKLDSLAFGLDWNYEHVRRAVVCYNAGCSRYPNSIPSSTQSYFQRVWDYYSKNK